MNRCYPRTPLNCLAMLGVALGALTAQNATAQVSVDVSPRGVRVDTNGRRAVGVANDQGGRMQINCAKACLDCSKHCAKEAISAGGEGDYQHCLMACLDCAKACIDCGVGCMSGDCRPADMKACQQACRDCAELCKQHEDAACQECAQMCTKLPDKLSRAG